jgi:hypothetical protein
MGGNAQGRHSLLPCGAFAAARVRCPSIQIFGNGIPIMSPGQNTWTLNIQPLGQFRPHRGFLLARPTLLSSVARLLHTAGCRAVPSLCGLRLARAVPCPAL